MIGHYLLTLTEEQEDIVLTRHFNPVLVPGAVGYCLVATVTGGRYTDECASRGEDCIERQTRLQKAGARWVNLRRFDAAFRYEILCERFGAPRINAAIRNRILSNRARRALSRETPLVGVGASRPTGDPA